MPPHQRYRATLQSIRRFTPETTHYSFALEAGQHLSYQAGQFAELEYGSQPGESRAYSIASSPHHLPRLDFCVRWLPKGQVSGMLHSKKIGDSIYLQASFGSFILNEQHERYLFVATGTGIAPIRAMLQRLYEIKPEASATLVFGCHDSRHIYFREEFQQLAQQHQGFSFVPVLSQPETGWTGATGHVQDVLAKIDPAGADCYICGSPDMTRSTLTALNERGVPPERLHTEQW